MIDACQPESNWPIKPCGTNNCTNSPGVTPTSQEGSRSDRMTGSGTQQASGVEALAAHIGEGGHRAFAGKHDHVAHYRLSAGAIPLAYGLAHILVIARALTKRPLWVPEAVLDILPESGHAKRPLPIKMPR